MHYNVSIYSIKVYDFLIKEYAGYRIRTYIAGLAYDSEEDIYEYHP